MLTAGLLVVFPLLMAFAAFSDLLTMTIPNRVPAILGVAFLIVAIASGMPFQTMSIHVAAGLLMLALTFGAFAAGWMGGGDAKLMAVTALWLGPTEALAQYLMIGSVLGGVLTLCLLAARGRIAPVTGVGFVDHLLDRDTGIPYGIALGAAGLVAFTSSDWVDLALASAF